MFEINLYQKICSEADHHAQDIHSYRYQTATRLFKSALFKGQVSRLIKRLLRHRQWLLDLSAFKPRADLQGSSYAGLKVVEITKIVGTEGRSADFDIDFHPVAERSRERWINMALVNLSCCPTVQPVELIQIGDVYFVRDGHHRISVARALGQKAIDAEVTVWKTCCPSLPHRANIALHLMHLTD